MNQPKLPVVTSGRRKNLYVQARLRITKVEGPEEVIGGMIATYRVVEFNISDPPKERMELVNWVVKDGNRTLKTLSKHGDTLEYEIPHELEGKTILVMPYLVKPSPNVSVLTLVSHSRVLSAPGEEEQYVDADTVFITEAAQFPSLTLTLVDEYREENQPSNWKITVRYEPPGDRTPKPEFPKVTWSGSTPAAEWMVFESRKADPIGGEAEVELEITINGKKSKIKRSFHIRAKNPPKDDIVAHTRSVLREIYNKEDSTLENIIITAIYHESNPKWCPFHGNGLPVVSFDYGFGVMQLTGPDTSIGEVWNWKEQVRAGIEKKVKPALAHALKKFNAHKAYTYEHVAKEIWIKYNRPVDEYYEWDDSGHRWTKAKKWSHLICYPTSNVGWNTEKEPNKGLGIEQLHERDKLEIRKGEGPNHHAGLWRHYGVCYADCCFLKEYTIATHESFPDKEYISDEAG